MLDLFGNSCIAIEDVTPQSEPPPVQSSPVADNASADEAEALPPVQLYDVFLKRVPPNVKKAGVIAAIINNSSGSITEEELLVAMKTGNRRMVAHVDLAEAQQIMAAVKDAGGVAEFRKI